MTGKVAKNSAAFRAFWPTIVNVTYCMLVSDYHSSIANIVEYKYQQYKSTWNGRFSYVAETENINIMKYLLDMCSIQTLVRRYYFNQFIPSYSLHASIAGEYKDNFEFAPILALYLPELIKYEFMNVSLTKCDIDDLGGEDDEYSPNEYDEIDGMKFVGISCDLFLFFVYIFVFFVAQG